MRHLFIPDTQVKKGVPMDHLRALGNYIVEKKPDVIIHIGDHADMPSLSSYEKTGSKYFENMRYRDDIEASRLGMEILLEPMVRYNNMQKRNKKALYRPRMDLTLGNHEYRIQRTINDDPVKLEGLMSMSDLGYEEYGWTVHPFLHHVEIDGVLYSHYHKNPNSPMGNPMGGTIQSKLNNMKQSFSNGHNQMLQYGIAYTGSGRRLHGLQAGAFYMHDEGFMGLQGNKQHWRGVVVKNEVKDGQYDPCFVSLDYLLNNYR
jgi:hypothetical protein|tara:strand:- start:865 stop:1644 length:780 start_codon:yes stop_codon:yes gene_type:complete